MRGLLLVSLLLFVVLPMLVAALRGIANHAISTVLPTPSPQQQVLVTPGSAGLPQPSRR